MALGTILSIVLIGAIVIFLLYVVSARNRIIRLDNGVDNAWAQIDVQLKRRADLIPNLVETVKGYAAHEKGVLEGVTAARAGLVNAKTPEEANAANNVLTAALGKLFAVAEAYPDLKANQNFLQLQDELTHTENKVGFARQFYNDEVLRYNNAVTTFPGTLFAGSLGKVRRAMLEIAPADRNVPQVRF